MDTSEQYIKMCEKAEEIQTLFLKLPPEEQIDKSWITINAVWLPRQDQLQEMSEYYPSTLLLCKFFWDFFRDGYMPDDSSMEQLWLAFVMKEKYNKTWDGENWNG